MFVKWIICSVPEASRAAFSTAQEQWRELTEVKGFLGQIGGWNRAFPSEACILCFWADEVAYQAFMRDVHDSIAGPSEQEQTYEAIEISLFETLFDIEGEFDSITDALGEGSLLRTADYSIKSGRESHFIQMQHLVWNPGMAESGDMLAGSFGHERDDALRYFVSTIWRDANAHDSFTNQQLQGLMIQCEIAHDLQRITGRIVSLDPAWFVPKSS